MSPELLCLQGVARVERREYRPLERAQIKWRRRRPFYWALKSLGSS